MRRRLLLAGAATLAGCATDGSGTAPAPATPPPPRVRTGDRWVYESVNAYNRQRTGVSTMRVATVAPQLRIEVVAENGARLPDEVYADPWRAVSEPFYDVPQVFRDPVPFLPPKLEPGSHKMRTTYRVEGMDVDLYWSDQARAVGWQRVRVPAGEFDALRIEREIAFVHSNGFRKASRRSETLWYAPAVNRWVKREWNGVYFWAVEARPPLREDWVIVNLLEYAPAGG
jgi:hypothetical protein